MLTAKDEAARVAPRTASTPKCDPGIPAKKSIGVSHSGTSPAKSRVLGSRRARQTASGILFFSAAGCAVFAIGALGVNNVHAALAFTAMVALWTLGEGVAR